MRHFASYVIGFIAAAIIYNTLVWAFGRIGVHAHELLPFPIERSIGRYDIGESDEDTTLAGHAFFIFASVVAVNIGAALYRRTLSPWRTTSEKTTSKAWWFISTFLVFCFPVFQLLSERISTGVPGFVVSVLELAVPVYVAWKTWTWWKAASVAAE